jgi:DNA-directed RNA polymerase specialized sigma24 family protein
MEAKLQQDRCTQNDYVELFAGSARSLHWLCYTLTGDSELAKKVLEASLEQSLKGADRVFRDWMVSWARRQIIKACAQILRPWMLAADHEPYLVFPRKSNALNLSHLDAVLIQPSEVLQERLLQLDSLHRLVLVLRAIEGYSRRETSLLLNIDDRLCEWIYLRAVEAIQDRHCAEEIYHMAGLRDESGCDLARAGD